MSINSGTTVYFKSCQRCGGDRTLENDFDGWYVLCLHCGHVSYPDIPDARVKRRAEMSAARAEIQAVALRSVQGDWAEQLRKAS